SLAEADPDAPDLAAEVASGRRAAVEGLRARLDAARKVDDTDQVLALRDELGGHLAGDPLRELGGELVAWPLGLVRRGLAQDPLRLDVVELATRVAARFAGTSEGASLRKSLPVLRRSVGLCPRCAKPYAGDDDACPECLARGATLRLATPGDDDAA